MAGDMAGQINFLTMENQMPLECTMGGHNDKKQPVMKIFCVNLGAKFAPVTVDPQGNFRLWTDSQ